MSTVAPSPALFDQKGWRVPAPGHRTFSRSPKWFYRTSEALPDAETVLARAQKHLGVGGSPSAFVAALGALEASLAGDEALRPLLGGARVPFVLPRLEAGPDLGGVLEQRLLPAVASAFEALHPDRHFKAVLQDKTSLAGRLAVQPGSRYDALLAAAAAGPVCGFYFPQALQEYDIDSQVAQMAALPGHPGLVLSGPLDVAAALVGCPELLLHDDAYAPVLCLSAVQHADPRLVCCFKSYGPHLEFWCLSQMLTPALKQVSEQWAGGLTVFAPLDG